MPHGAQNVFSTQKVAGLLSVQMSACSYFAIVIIILVIKALFSLPHKNAGLNRLQSYIYNHDVLSFNKIKSLASIQCFF